MIMPALAADQKADPHEQRGQRRKQNGGAEIAHGPLRPPRNGGKIRRAQYVGGLGPQRKSLGERGNPGFRPILGARFPSALTLTLRQSEARMLPGETRSRSSPPCQPPCRLPPPPRKPKRAAPRAPGPETQLTAEQKRLIRVSFLRIEPALDLVAQLFFLKLFRLDPASARSSPAPSRCKRANSPPALSSP